MPVHESAVKADEPLMYVHSAKAVRRVSDAFRTAPSTRLFIVTHVDGTTKRCVAWKCDIVKGAGVQHPAFTRLLSPTTEDIALAAATTRGAGDEEPSAEFKPDSFYRRVSLADVRALVGGT